MHRTSGYVVLTSLLLLRIRGTDAAAEDSPEFRNKVPAKLVWATKGEDVELPCDLTPPTPTDNLNMVLWFKDEIGIPLYSLDARGGDLNAALHWAVSDNLGRRTYFQVADGHDAKLKIRNVSRSDQGVFRCRVDFVNSPTRNFRINVTLVEEPSNPVIYDAQGREVTGVGGPFLEGYDLLLTCQVSGGRPKPSVTWWKEGELLDGVIDTAIVDVGSASKFTVNHLFISKITRSLWGSKLECRAQSGPMERPIVREVPLDIYLKPAMVKIVLSEEVIYANRPVAARCETWGSSPAAKIIWKLGGQAIRDPNVSTTQRSNSTVSKLALVLGRDDDGKELTCRAENPRFPGGVLEETRILRVAYAPIVVAQLATGYVLDTLREGDDLKLVCNVQSNPPPDKVIWYQDDTRLQHDVSAGILVASNTLTIRALTLAHSGEYSCEAANSVGEDHSKPLLIYMKYPPRCREGHDRQEIIAGKGETVLVTCEVEAIPDEISRFSWTFNKTLRDVLHMPNTNTHNKGLVSVLEYTPINDGDFGSLACWATNSVGRQTYPCVFHIVPAKPPQPPIDCSLHNDNNSSLMVNCLAGSDGGSPQHFLLEVRDGDFQNGPSVQVIPQTLQTPQSDQGEAGETPPIYQDRKPQPSFQLHDLQPGFDYTIYVYAVNGHGKSNPALLRHVRVAELVGGELRSKGAFLDDLKKVLPRGTSDNLLVISAIIGAAGLVLIGIGLAIGLIFCKRRPNAPGRRGPDDFTTPTYVPAQRIEPRVRYSNERRRSQRTSLYVEENRNEPDLLQQVEIDLHG